MTEAEWLAATDPTPMLGSDVATVSSRKRNLFGLACCRRIARMLDDPRARAAFRTAEHFIEGSISAAELTALHVPLGEAVADAWYARYGAEADAQFCHHPGYSAACAAEGAVYAIGSLYDGLASGVLPSTLQRGYAAEGAAHLHAGRAAVSEAHAYIQLARCTSLPPEQALSVYERCELFLDRMHRSELLFQVGLLRDIFGNPFRPAAVEPAWRTETAVALARQMYESRDFAAMPILADALQEAGCDSAEVLDHCRGSGQHVRGCWVVDLVLEKE